MSGQDRDEPEEMTGVRAVDLRDEATRVAILAQDTPTPPAPQPHDAFILAYPRLLELAGVARRPALAVAAVDGRNRIVASQLVEAGDAITIGRHSRCRFRLPAGAISLRHIAALVVSGGEEVPPVLRIWDLHTGQPFRTEDGQFNGAVMAEGPTFVAVGNYAIWFVPCGIGNQWPEQGADAWKSLPPRVFTDRREPAPREEKRRRLASPTHHKSVVDEPSLVTGIPAPLLLGDQKDPEIAWGTIVVRCGPMKVARALSAERLERGILVGRYSRCGFTLGELDTNISRVHLFLVRIGMDVWAIDTASTNGILRNGKALEAGVLSNADHLQLSSDTILEWRKTERPEA